MRPSGWSGSWMSSKRARGPLGSRHRSSARARATDGRIAMPARAAAARARPLDPRWRTPGCGCRHSAPGNDPAWRCARSDRPPRATRYSDRCSMAQRLPMRPSACRASGVSVNPRCSYCAASAARSRVTTPTWSSAMPLTWRFRSPAAAIPRVPPPHLVPCRHQRMRTHRVAICSRRCADLRLPGQQPRHHRCIHRIRRGERRAEQERPASAEALSRVRPHRLDAGDVGQRLRRATQPGEITPEIHPHRLPQCR